MNDRFARLGLDEFRTFAKQGAWYVDEQGAPFVVIEEEENEERATYGILVPACRGHDNKAYARAIPNIPHAARRIVELEEAVAAAIYLLKVSGRIASRSVWEAIERLEAVEAKEQVE